MTTSFHTFAFSYFHYLPKRDQGKRSFLIETTSWFVFVRVDVLDTSASAALRAPLGREVVFLCSRDPVGVQGRSSSAGTNSQSCSSYGSLYAI